MDGGRVLSGGCRLEVVGWGGGGGVPGGGVGFGRGGGVVWSLFSLSHRFFIMSTLVWHYMQPCKCKTEGSLQIHVGPQPLTTPSGHGSF